MIKDGVCYFVTQYHGYLVFVLHQVEDATRNEHMSSLKKKMARIILLLTPQKVFMLIVSMWVMRKQKGGSVLPPIKGLKKET